MSSQGEGTSLPRAHVARDRLLAKLAMATRGKLTMVCANAGYGKTTLLSAFARSEGWRTEWYYLTPADRDVARLAEGLEASLRRLSRTAEPKGPRRARARQSGTPSAAVLGESLLKLASGVGQGNTLLVLDDFHNVDNAAEVNSLLGTLIEASPPSLRFVVLSRSIPRMLTRLKARQEASLIEEKDLAFTLEETRSFLREESALNLTDEEVALIHHRTEGWAAGIAMVAQSLRYGDQLRVMAVLDDPVASAWLVYDYLAEEVFDRQDQAVQQFLIRTSILNRMTAPACDYLLGASASQRTLLSLEERGLFTTSTDFPKYSFRYHPLFLEFLRQKLYQLEDRESVERLHRLAAEYYERQGDWEECISHYMRASEPGRAAAVVEKIGERYIFSGFSQTVEQWLRALPEEVVSTRPWLLALRGRLNNMSGRYDEALRLLERALRLFRTQGNDTGEAWASGETAYVHYRRGELQQSVREFTAALSVGKSGAESRNQLLIMQAMAYRDAGMVEDSIAACNEALQELSGIADETTRLWGQSRVARNLALAQMETGQIESALQSARSAVALCIANQIGEHEESWALASLGAVLWANAEFQEGLAAFTRAISLSGLYSRNLQQFVAGWLGNLYRDSGQLSEADSAYQHGTGIAQLERTFAALVSPGQRNGRAASSWDLYRQHKDADSLVVRATAEVVYATALRREQRAPDAYQHIREAVRQLKGSGYRLRLASALLHQARIEMDIAKPADARESLARGLEIASADGYRHLFWWDTDAVALLCARALADNIFPDYAADLAARRLDGANASVFAPLLQDKRADVRQRAQSLLSSLSRHGDGGVREEILANCADPRIRESLLRDINEGIISAAGVQSLHSQQGLSWREVEILVEYYLRPALGPAPMSGQLRKECAERLNISEYTVRCHVNSIRSKLALPAWVSGSRVLDWAQEEGLLPSSWRAAPAGEAPGG